MLQYPLTKESAGPHYWISLHSVASEYPTHGTDKDTEEFKQFVHYFIEHFPCSDCRKHGLYYFHNNPPKGTTRREVFDWACSFHNYVNKHTGKPEEDCGSMLDTHSCKSCFTKKDTLPEALPGSMGDVRASSVKLFETLCQEADLPVPKIIFRPCPPFPWTSCTRIGKDNSNPVVYLNPTQYGPKTVVHEFVHYREKMKGNDKVAADEWEVDRMAHDIIHKNFPTELDIEPPREGSIMTDKNVSIIDKRMSSIKKRFPHYGAYLSETDYINREEEKSESRGQRGGKGDGFVAMFDDVYAPLGELLGVDKRDLSSNQVSQIVGNVAGALMDANLSPLGSVVTSTISSLALFTTGIFARSSMSGGDRLFVANLASNLFYGNIRELANPKELPKLMENAKVAGYHLSRLDFANFLESLTNNYDKLLSYTGKPPPDSTPAPIVPQSPSPPISQDLGTRFSPGSIAAEQRREFEQFGPVRRIPVGGYETPGYAGPAGPIPFPLITPPEPTEDYYDPSNPNIGNPSLDSISSYMNTKAMAGSTGNAIETDRLSINLYNDQEYMNEAQGYGSDEEML